jgi:hypothetical protein
MGRSDSLHNRLLAAKEQDTLELLTKGITCNPLDKYTKGNMPEVHVAKLMFTLEFINISLILKWKNYHNGKLLAIPFGNEANKIENHNHIGEKLLTAACKITEADNISISIPIQCQEATLNRKTPISFLIYNLSQDNINSLMQCSIWSSQAITFRVTELHPPCPDFLFTIKGFVFHDNEPILQLIKDTWNSNTILALIDTIIQTFSKDCQDEISNSIHSFLRLVSIIFLDYKMKGSVDAPHFNVYAESQLLKDNDVWSLYSVGQAISTNFIKKLNMIVFI